MTSSATDKMFEIYTFFENRTEIRTFFENRTEMCILFENRFEIYSYILFENRTEISNILSMADGVTISTIIIPLLESFLVKDYVKRRVSFFIYKKDKELKRYAQLQSLLIT